MSSQPAAFMSYVRFVDQHEGGRLTQFRERLAAEVQVQTGEEFLIFQDRNDIAWGQNWKARIDESLDTATLLIPIVTPSFFRSPACREELTRFLERERTLGRGDLILPVYYVSTPELDDPKRREADELARVLASRQYADWRELRFEPFTSPVVGKALAQLASRMRDSFWREAETPAARPRRVAARSPASRTRTAKSTTTRRAPAAAKHEPPTHVVDAYQRGDYATIGAAIEAARPGDRILVRPGLYQEGLVMDKPLELLGDGPLSEIEVQARDQEALVFRASIGRVANLTLREVASEGGRFAVDISQGRLELEGCDISSQSTSPVVIRDGADPRLRRNHIHDGKYAGVVVYDSGLGTLEDNEITGNGYSGVEIKTGGNPTLRRNQIHDNKDCGVYVYDKGLGTLEDNDITANGESGVEIENGGNPTLRGNQIHDNNGSGVFVHDKGLGTLEDNDITANAQAGVTIQTAGNPTLRGNQIHDNKASGVCVEDSGLGTLEDNDITANNFFGVMIQTGGNPTLRGNQIHDNKDCGVYVHDKGLGTLEDNDITANAQAGVTIQTDSNPTLRRNQIHDNKAIGVFVYGGGLGTLEDNDITANAQDGVTILTDGNPTLRRNRINRNNYMAVRVNMGGRGVIEDNDLTGNTRGPWHIAEESKPNVKRSGNHE